MLRLAAGAIGAVFCLSVSSAHVSLEQVEARVGASYKAVLRVLHGCRGSPTTAIRVRIPPGVLAVRPMPKPGWTLDVVTGPYDRPYSLRGARVSKGVIEIVWSGGRLADAHYDEFVFIGTIAPELSPGQIIYFPVVQECERGVHRWVDIPTAASRNGHEEDSTEPAPGLRLLPAK